MWQLLSKKKGSAVEQNWDKYRDSLFVQQKMKVEAKVRVIRNNATGTVVDVSSDGQKVKVRLDEGNGKMMKLQKKCNFLLISEPPQVQYLYWFEIGCPFPKSSCRYILEEFLRTEEPTFSERELLTFTTKSVRDFPVIEGKLVTWAGQEFKECEWKSILKNWEIVFPKISAVGMGEQGHPLETEAACIAEKIKLRSKCWDMARKTKLRPRYVNHFRIDMFGNVISALRPDCNRALCSWDVDHVFPRSRGGRTVLENLAPVQCHANRAVKRDRLLQALDPLSLQCGLSQPQFEALLKHVDGRGGAGRGCRQNLAHERSRATGWLTAAPREGFGLKDFQKHVGRTEDGGRLWRFLAAWEDQQREGMKADWNAMIAAMDDDGAAATEGAGLVAVREASEEMPAAA